MELDKLLQIGTIIKYKQTLLMIVGYCKNLKIKTLFEYDYLCCIYPIGAKGFKSLIPIKHRKIDKIVHIGYNSKKLNHVNDILEDIKSIVQEAKDERR